MLVLALADIMETYVGAHTQHHSHHFVSEFSSADCTAPTLLSHGSQDSRILNTWLYGRDSCTLLADTHPSTPFLPSLHEEQKSGTPQGQQQLFIGNICSSPPSTDSSLQQSIPLPCAYPQHFMHSKSGQEHSPPSPPFINLLAAPHDVFCRAQPPSPPLDTPELIQRSLPQVCEPLSPRSTSLGSLELSPLAPMRSGHSQAASPLGCRPYPCGHDDDPSLPYKRQRRWDGSDTDISSVQAIGFADADFNLESQLSPLELLSPELPMTTWPTPADIFHSLNPGDSDDMRHETWGDNTVVFNAMNGYGGMLQNSSAPQNSSKARGLSLDSAGLEDLRFMASKISSVHQPMRSRTTLLKPMPELQGFWEPNQQMEINQISPHSPRSSSLLLPLDNFDTELSSCDATPDVDDLSSSAEANAAALPELFDDAPFGFSPVQELPDLEMEDVPSAPSSPRSPLMQLIPDASDDMFIVPSDGTISPSLLGPPAPGEGLGLFVDPSGVDPPFARSPSPSDYELHILEGQVDISTSGLSEDEYQMLRTFYDAVQQAEASARERENALDRRVKDISALLDPSKVVSDPTVMYTRRQELRTASEMRAEARKERKREKQRLREVGAILDLKLDLDRSVFQGRGSMRSIPQLVANMVLKRRDTSRSLASRKPAGAGRSTPTNLRASMNAEDSSGEPEVGLE